MNNLNKSISLLITILGNETENLTKELKEISKKLDAELAKKRQS